MLEEGEVVYLFLPLAHAFAKLIQFVTLDLGGTLAYWEKDPQKIIPNLMETKPTYFPSVPRMFEKIYTLATSNAEDPEQLAAGGAGGAEGAPDAARRRRRCREELQAGFDKAEEALYKNVRGLFGGNIRQCVTGAAPIAKEILEFFYACGVPVMEGYGMTETSTIATANTPEDFRFGSVGKFIPGVEGKVAEDGELLLRGPEHLPGLLQERGGHRRDDRGRLAAHRRPRQDRRGRLRLHRRPQEGHHHHRGRQEHHARPTSRTASSRTAGSRRRWWSATGGRIWSR